MLPNPNMSMPNRAQRLAQMLQKQPAQGMQTAKAMPLQAPQVNNRSNMPMKRQGGSYG